MRPKQTAKTLAVTSPDIITVDNIRCLTSDNDLDIMKTKTFTFILICIFSLSLLTCKKTKLSGDNRMFVGTWHWIYGYGDKGTTDHKLHIMENGKYKLYKGSKKVDHGRIISEGKYLRFKSDNVVDKISIQVIMLNKSIIREYSDNIITFAESDHCADCRESTFVRD